MEIYSIDVTPQELAFLRQSLDLITVSGKDAKFIANLQVKLENEMLDIQKAKEEQKALELSKALTIDKQKTISKQ